MAKATAGGVIGIVAAAALLSGCTGGNDEPTPGTSATSASPSASATTAETSATPEEPTDSVPATAEDLVGDWRDDDADWTVHFRSDGTYGEDYQGITDFRVGEYSITDGKVSLAGGDGNTDTGRVEGSALRFRLGTLQRVAAE